MAITKTMTLSVRTVFGNKRVVLGTIGMTGTYATGGIAIAAEDFGLSGLDHLQLGSLDGFAMEHDTVNAKIKTLSSAGNELGSGAVNLSAANVSFIAIGKD